MSERQPFYENKSATDFGEHLFLIRAEFANVTDSYAFLVLAALQRVSNRSR